MNKIKSFGSFKINENIETTNRELTLYRLTSHPVIDLSNPGEFYFSDSSKVNPDFLDNKKSNNFYLITVKCNSSNIDHEKSKLECDKLNCDCVVAVKDDKSCEVISVEPYKK
jgi:hypothetical protein